MIYEIFNEREINILIGNKSNKKENKCNVITNIKNKHKEINNKTINQKSLLNFLKYSLNITWRENVLSYENSGLLNSTHY